MVNKFQMASAEEELDAALSRIEPGRATLLPVIRIPRMMPPPLPIRQPNSWFRLAPTCLTAGSQQTTN
jgi:hypothetical protein